MPGKHSAPGNRRLVAEVFRFALLLLIFAAVGIGGAIWVSSTLEANSEGAIPVAATQDPTTTSVLPATLPPEPSTTTTTEPPSTTTTTAPTTTTTTTLPTVDPTELTVIVLNSTQRSGMAGRLTSDLADLGYQTLEPDNYRPALETSRIWFTEELEREAQLLLELVPDAIVEAFPEDDPQSDITVVLGASFDE